MRRPFFHSLLIVSAGLAMGLGTLSSCQWKKALKPSFLIVAVDRLGVNRSGCSGEKDDASRSGFAEICDESVRFTHAFTTSTMSAPAMGSILTGQYPYRSGLRHNGGGEFGTLSSLSETIPERALQLGYKTFFAAGSPPLLRRTGLHQGFEVFDDFIHPTGNRMHRPAREVVDLFMKWSDAEVRQEPMFAVLHMGDLQIPWQPMPDDSGRVRESTVRGQFEEIDESLAKLWAYLKRKKRWEQTTIVVVGLQGDSSEVRAGEIPALDLHSDTTHVTLLIKEGLREKTTEAGKPAYEWVPKSWSFDVNVSLADVGVTLLDWLESRDTKAVEIDEAKSLRSALKGPGEAVDEWRKQDRVIISESGWAKWQVDSALPIRAAIRKGPYLFINDTAPMIYNTLTDGFEVAPMPRKNHRTMELQNEFGTLVNGLGFRPFPGVDGSKQLEERWARSYFSRRLGARVTENSRMDEQRIELLAATSQTAKTWMELRSWERSEKGFPRPTICSQLVFSANSGLDLSSAIEAELARVCPFRGAKEIARWYRAKDGDERDRLFATILRVDQQRLSAVRIAEASLALGQIWEAGGSRRNELDGFEILLGQPEATRLRQQIMRRSRNQPEL